MIDKMSDLQNALSQNVRNFPDVITNFHRKWYFIAMERMLISWRSAMILRSNSLVVRALAEDRKCRCSKLRRRQAWQYNR